LASAKEERYATVFNSSVENRVEKALQEIENARQHGAYSSLHKFRADEEFLTIVFGG
jgi:hypothetical protein